MNHKKTTILGIITILSTVFTSIKAVVEGQQIDWQITATSIAAGWGLMHAADARKVNLLEEEVKATNGKGN